MSRLLVISVLAASVLPLAVLPAHAQRPGADPGVLGQQGAAALEARRFDEAFELFTQATALLPREAALWYGAGLAAFMLGRNADAEAALGRAVDLAPRFTDASALLGEVQYRAGRVREAMATYEAALAHAPDEVHVLERLEAWRRDLQVSDRFFESRGAHFIVRFAGPADQALAGRAVEMLEAAYWRIGGELGAYPPEPITVILYTDEQFRDVTRAPEWSGGTYDGRIRVPVRGALGTPADLERVLVHEFVHAVVAMLGGPQVPLWLNEGLAVVFEPGGLDAAARMLAAAASRPRLADLHGGFGRLDRREAQVAYALSAVAVRRMLDLRGAPAVTALLQDLARGAEFPAAFRQRMAMTYAEFESVVR
jgi:hypothetical protein